MGKTLTPKQQIDVLIKHIQMNAKDIMIEIINDEVIPTMLEMIDKHVYDVYEPKVYKRRYERGGLADPTNFDYTVDIDGDCIVFSVKNITAPVEEGEGLYLDYILASGEYRPYMKRDFYEPTREIMRDVLPKLIKEKFEKRGIRVSFNVVVK